MRTAGPYPGAVPTPDEKLAPDTITCVDCGEDARLLSVSDADEHGERIAVYRCTGCLDRWDVVVDPALPGDPLVDDEHGVGPEAPLREGET